MGELVLSFYHVGPEDGTWVIGLGGKCRYPLSQLSVPGSVSTKITLEKTKMEKRGERGSHTGRLWKETREEEHTLLQVVSTSPPGPGGW